MDRNEKLFERFTEKLRTQQVIGCTQPEPYEMHFEFGDGSIAVVTVNRNEQLYVDDIVGEEV